jgi:large subunit ribosomal protein L12e
MPPKADPTEVKYIWIKVFGGEGGPASTLAPKLGPLGLNAKKIGEDIIKESSKMKGIR